MPEYIVRCPNGHFLTSLVIRVHIPTTEAVQSRGYCHRCSTKFDGQPERKAVIVTRERAA